MSNPARYAAVLMCVVLAGCDAASPRTEDRTFTAPARDTLYTTPYGSFRTIDKVWQNNEYMLAHPSVPGAELCTAYLTDDPAQADEVRDELRALADEITAGCTTEYEKAEALAMWTGLNIAYDYANEDGGLEVMTAQSVLRDRRTVCTGFANLFSCLCAAEDIYCLFLIGGTSSGGYQRSELLEAPANHAWNAFYADGHWYFSDPTWISDLGYEDGVLTGGEEILTFYAVFGYGEMCTEHRIDRCEYTDVFDRKTK